MDGCATRTDRSGARDTPLRAPEQGLPEFDSKKTRTPLRHQRLKHELVEHVSKTLRVPLTGTETIKVLMQKGMAAIYDQAPAHGQDPVGFGKHASLCYEELWVSHRSYATWVMETSWENGDDACPRLHRLANWLEERKKRMDIATPRKAAASSHTDPAAPTIQKTMTGPSGTSSGYVKPSPESDPKTQEMIQTLANAVVELKEALKGELPRKGQRSNPSEATDLSFELQPQ